MSQRSLHITYIFFFPDGGIPPCPLGYVNNRCLLKFLPLSRAVTGATRHSVCGLEIVIVAVLTSRFEPA